MFQINWKLKALYKAYFNLKLTFHFYKNILLKRSKVDIKKLGSNNMLKQ